MNDAMQQMNAISKGTLLEALGIVITQAGMGHVEATMPVDARTHQPYGILHGGASAALSESLGSYGSHLLVAESGALSVGVELNINHLRSKRDGVVTGIARIVHQGRSTHVWNVEIVDEEKNLIAISRITVLIKKKEA